MNTVIKECEQILDEILNKDPKNFKSQAAKIYEACFWGSRQVDVAKRRMRNYLLDTFAGGDDDGVYYGLNHFEKVFFETIANTLIDEAAESYHKKEPLSGLELVYVNRTSPGLAWPEGEQWGNNSEKLLALLEERKELDRRYLARRAALACEVIDLCDAKKIRMFTGRYISKEEAKRNFIEYDGISFHDKLDPDDDDDGLPF